MDMVALWWIESGAGSHESIVSCGRSGRIVRAPGALAKYRQTERKIVYIESRPELGVESLEAFDQALQRIRLIKGISNPETILLLSRHKI
jgi:hypothetical protein